MITERTPLTSLHREKKQSQKGAQACLQNDSLSDSLFDSLEEGSRYLTPLKGSYVTPLREPRFCLQNGSFYDSPPQTESRSMLQLPSERESRHNGYFYPLPLCITVPMAVSLAHLSTLYWCNASEEGGISERSLSAH